MTQQSNNSPTDPLSQAFGVPTHIDDQPNKQPLSVVEYLEMTPEEEVRKFRENVDADFFYARENIMATIEKAQRALDKAIDLAAAAQAPRAYEVVGNMVKIVIDSNHALLDLSKKSKELKALELVVPDSSGSTVTNNLFVGSMEELQSALRDMGVKTDARQVTKG